MVRRAAAFRLGKFAEMIEPEAVAKEIIPLFQDLTHDGMLKGCISNIQVGLLRFLCLTCANQDFIGCRSRFSAIASCGDLWLPSTTSEQGRVCAACLANCTKVCSGNLWLYKCLVRAFNPVTLCIHHAATVHPHLVCNDS